MSAIIFTFYIQDATTGLILTIISTGVGVLMVFFVALGFIFNALKGIKGELMNQITEHKTETKECVDQVKIKVSGKVGYPHFEQTIDHVEDTIQINKEIEADHYNKLSGGMALLISKLIPDAKWDGK